ncbi:hypothetical protein BSLA_02f4452 [Burkholderia stabilis]|nr:hypothetical protein BSLA_02f4452 [Burkholderia stabilis]
MSSRYVYAHKPRSMNGACGAISCRPCINVGKPVALTRQHIDATIASVP